MTAIGRQTILRALGLGAIPVVVMAAVEVVGARAAAGAWPLALWLFLWLLSAAVVVGGRWLILSSRSGLRVTALAAGILLGGLAMVWISVVADQAACFVGVPNCD